MLQALKDGARLKLKDGRWLGFREYGDPHGLPVLAFHGTPGSRSMFEIGDRPSRARNLWLIAVERPGFGLSSEVASRTLRDWPRDVAEFADALGLDRFAIAGVSGGGPYATACAALMPDRVSALALISPMGPVRPPEGASAIGPNHHMLFRILSGLEFVTKPGAAAGRYLFAHAPQTTQSIFLQRLRETDRAILSRPEVWDGVRKTLSEGFAGGCGAIQDLKIFGEPWNIPFDAIRAPAFIWQGTADVHVPFAASRRLCDLIPGCRFIELKGQGHYWVIDHIDDVLQTLKNAALGHGAGTGAEHVS